MSKNAQTAQPENENINGTIPLIGSITVGQHTKVLNIDEWGYASWGGERGGRSDI